MLHEEPLIKEGMPWDGVLIVSEDLDSQAQ